MNRHVGGTLHTQISFVPGIHPRLIAFLAFAELSAQVCRQNWTILLNYWATLLAKDAIKNAVKIRGPKEFP